MSVGYAAGTISVTSGSKIVTGDGTEWVTAGVRRGWIIRLPNGSIGWIDNVVSNTSLELADEYSGSTQSGQPYRASASGGLVTSLADSISQLREDFQGVVEGPGEGKFPNGNNAEPSVRGDADQDTGVNFPGISNTLDLVTGGTRRGRLSSSAFQIDVPVTGTAVTQSPTDDTAGRVPVMREGGIAGLAATGNLSTSVTDLNDATTSGYFGVSTSAANRPVSTNFTSVVHVVRDGAGGRIVQNWRAPGPGAFRGRVWERAFDGSVWTDWEEALNTLTGAFGWGLDGLPFEGDGKNLDNYQTSGLFYFAQGNAPDNRPAARPGLLTVKAASLPSTRIMQEWQSFETFQIYRRTRNLDGNWTGWVELYHTSNTTVDGSGNIMEASPIVRLFNDATEEPNQPVGATMQRVGPGHYTLTGCPPLASEGWRTRDAVGTKGDTLATVGDPVWVGDTLHVRTYVDGQPADIPEGGFVMLRFWEAKEEGDEPPAVESLTEAQEQEAALEAERAQMVCSRFQAKAALHMAGKLDAATAAVANADAVTQIAWAEAGEFTRTSPAIASLAPALEMTDAELDDLFRTAMQIEA